MPHHPIQPLARALRRGLFISVLATVPVVPSMVQAQESAGEALRQYNILPAAWTRR